MKPIHRTALASAIALGLAAPAYAAPQAEATELEQIVVTGTRAKDRTVLESAVPIDVITRDDLRLGHPRLDRSAPLSHGKA